GEALARETELARDHGLVVEADARARHGAVVRALDLAGTLGIRQVRIATTEGSSTQAEQP
uniref:ExbD/TolR family protein n=1 Tax=Halomonas sp. TaxID=1486246 RepID=UPI0035614954